MTELRAFLQSRLAATSAKVAELSDEIHLLNLRLSEAMLEHGMATNELNELSAAAEAIGFTQTHSYSSKSKISTEAQITIKQAIRSILMDRGPQNSSKIFASINSMYFDNNLERTSFSPQLSRLRKVGEVDLEGANWTLTRQGQEKYFLLDGRHDGGSESDAPEENEPSDVATSNGSDAGSADNLFG